MRALFVILCLVFCAGCITQRDRVAYKRAELVLIDRGAAGDALAAACGEEVANANLDTGAGEVALGPADLTPEAAKANSAAIAQARAGRQAIVGALQRAGSYLTDRWPELGVIVTLVGAGAAAWKKYREYKAVAETVVEGVGSVANKETKAAVRTLAADYGVLPLVDKVVQRIDPSTEA